MKALKEALAKYEANDHDPWSVLHGVARRDKPYLDAAIKIWPTLNPQQKALLMSYGGPIGGFDKKDREPLVNVKNFTDFDAEIGLGPSIDLAKEIVHQHGDQKQVWKAVDKIRM